MQAEPLANGLWAAAAGDASGHEAAPLQLCAAGTVSPLHLFEGITTASISAAYALSSTCWKVSEQTQAVLFGGGEFTAR